MSQRPRLESDAKPGCFSGFNLARLLRRKSSSDVDTCLRGGDTVGDQKSEVNELTGGAGRHRNLLPYGDGVDWATNFESPPSYCPPEYLLNDAKMPVLDAEIIKTIEAKLDGLDPQLRVLSLKIHDHPELAFKETYAHDIMTDFMEQHGFNVTRHYAGLDTAWRAEYTFGRGGRVLGVNSEMDALPGIGHACGHNLIAICGLGIAVAVKTALEVHRVPGKVVILGTPGEEGVGGKIILLERDAYKAMDVCLMAHPGPGPIGSSSNGTTSAAQSMYVEYSGKAAHAAAAPWEGKNALDAAVIAYSSISALRQQMKPDLRVHGIIEGSNWTANTIPDNARLTYIVRAPNKKDLADALERVKGCFWGAAASTGCKVKIEMHPAYYDLRQNSALGNEFARNVISRYDMTVNDVGSAASTDFGNVTYELPSLHPLFAIPTEINGGNHTPAFTKSAGTKEAHTATMKVTKGLALTGFRVLSDCNFFDEVKAAFEADKKARAAL
ncbi:putative peptidase family M20/M25/M40 [Lyophyllum shimeji]|uniref:Peptidase family M20/M25/M40 n=1 Tax=Lyophyllum shimeji TaxID=47721 RepID=A0A9P3UT97_LYOSH|nr:putative peptidase family M20/M25/M40 [Lyophyllum shimeji]